MHLLAAPTPLRGCADSPFLGASLPPVGPTSSDGGSDSTASTRSLSFSFGSRGLSSSPPPPPPPAGLGGKPSMGSWLHGTGLCKPCAWFWKPRGCANGADCFHCHSCPAGALRARRRVKFEAVKGLKKHRAVESEVLPEAFGSDAEEDMQQGESWSSVDEGSQSSGESAIQSIAQALEAETLPLPPGLDGPWTQQPNLNKPIPLSLAAALSPPPPPVPELPLPPVQAAAVVAAAVAAAVAPLMQLPLAPAAIPSAAAAPMSSVLPSIGSQMHCLGVCKPCAWFWKARGCANGQTCLHCHLCPAGELKSRKRVARAARALADLNSEEQRPQDHLQDSHAMGLDAPASCDLAAEQPAYINGLESLLQLSCRPSYQEGMELEEQMDLSWPSSQEPVRIFAADPSFDREQGLAALTARDLDSVEGFEEEDQEREQVQEQEQEQEELQVLPSLGSWLHGTGRCKPCTWLWKRQGCGNGAACQHCHACPPGEKKARRRAKLAGFRRNDEQEQKLEVPSISPSSELGISGGA